MNELQVIINEKPGSLTWNFEELKQEVEKQVAVYETIAYTDSNISEAKKDVANLRKLAKEVEDRRKEIKKQWMAPYNELEAQAKELVDIIDRPITLINSKVNDYEEKLRKKRAELIDSYFEGALEGLPDDVRESVKSKKYDRHWELKSVPKKDWQTAIDSIAGAAKTSLTVIEGMEEELRGPCRKVYVDTLDLGAVITKQKELEEQKRRVIEAELKRQAQEKAKREQEERAAQAAAQRAETTQNEPEIVQEAQARPASISTETFLQKEEKPSEGDLTLLRVKADEMQLAKITGYIKFIGADYEVLG